MSSIPSLELTLLAFACTGAIALCDTTNTARVAASKEPRLRPTVVITNAPSAPLQAKPGVLLQPALGASTNLPKPGLYKTVPYTCLVLVPDSGLDKGTVIVPPAAPEMPLVQPKLEFVPWPSAKK